MITNVSLVTIWVTDQDEAKRFYTDVLGFVEHTDITLGDGFRWCTVVHPRHPELQLVLQRPGMPSDDDMAEAIRRALAAGTMHGCGIDTDDCRAEYERLTGLGVTFLQEPQDRPYGVEAVFRDNSGNWLVMVEPKPYSGEDFPHG